MRWLPVPLLLLAAGCGMDESDFYDEYAAASCALLFECEPDMAQFFGDEEGCAALVALGTASSNDGCDYNAKAAKECVNELESGSCDDLGDGTEVPGACADVYEGDCLWNDTTTGYSTSGTWSYSSSTY